MSCIPSLTCSDGFNLGEIVWAKRDFDGIYWPGKINFISNNLTDTLSTTNKKFSCQIYSYFIQFFEYEQTHWTNDILPYRQYRDYMSKNILIHYESSPQNKYQFLNAIQQADYYDINQNSNNINYSSTSNSNQTACRNSTLYPINEYSLNYYSQSPNVYQQYLPNYSYNDQFSTNNCSSYCPQSTETSVQDNTIHGSIENFQQTTSILIITTKSYSNSSFISYLFNCFSTFLHHSIIYIDDIPSHFQHPNTSNISYLICLDNFNSIIQQQLDSTILNNLNAHINYLFLILNSSSNELIKHFYSRIINKKIIIILHYHLTFDNEPLLLCSGNRLTFEMIQMNLLKYLCSKIKYIESTEKEFYSINNIKNEPNEYVSVSSSSLIKHSKKLNKKNLKKKFKQHLSKKKIPTDCHVQNILDNFNPSK